MDTDQRSVDWENVIKKPVYTNDNKYIGHVDRLDEEHLLIKDRIIHARYYQISKKLLDIYQHGKVILKISEQELNSRYKMDRPTTFQ
jgi:sporulation protein YlmC with PRC-barrel domain